MIKYYNAGSSGRSYSSLKVDRAEGKVEFVVCSKYHLSPSVILNPEQVRDLITKLEPYAVSAVKIDPMIEGDSI